MPCFHRCSGRLLPSLAAACLLAWIGGCQQPSPPAPAKAAEKKSPETAASKPAPQQGPLSAKAVLEKMVAAYHRAATYRDLGMVRLMAQAGGKEIMNRQWPSSVVLVRPDKVQLKAYDAQVVSDGKQFRATIDYVPGQVLTQTAPAKLTLPMFDSDAILADALGAGPGGLPIQLALLLDDDPLKWILKDAEPPQLAEPIEIDGHDCYRVKIERPDGTLVMCIDQQDFVLRRLLPPLDLLRQRLEVEAKGPLDSLALVIEFTGAKLDGQVDPRLFAFELGKDAEAVKYFLPPPARLLGKKSPELKFVDLAGKPVTTESLAGKIAVLYFWAMPPDPDAAAARSTVPDLEQIYEKFKGNDRLVFLAVNLDSSKIENKTLQQFFDARKVHVPIVRDLEQTADPLHFKDCPLIGFMPIFVLGADGVVQYFDLQIYGPPGVEPKFRKDLPEQLHRLLSGQNVYPICLQRYEDQRRLRQQALEDAAKGTPPADAGVKEIPLPEVKIAPKSAPKHLKLTSLWKCTQVAKPGNILVAPRFGGAPRLAVIDAWKGIAEVGLNGKLLATHKFDIQKEELICYLRTAVGANGKRLFAGCAAGQQRVHLFDENWNLLVSYPADALENRHSGIADVQLADLDGDGRLRLYVGYWGVVGLQAASLDGRRLNSNRLLTNVRMAVGPSDQGRRNLICTNGHGSLAVVDSRLQLRDEIFVPRRLIQWIVGADLAGDNQLCWCGLTITPQKLGENMAVGVTLKGQELWAYPLPQGLPLQPIEPIIAGKVTSGGRGQWLLPGVDGSIHILDADGLLVDKFNYGAALCGLATVEIDGKPALVVATPGLVEAWRVE